MMFSVLCRYMFPDKQYSYVKSIREMRLLRNNTGILPFVGYSFSLKICPSYPKFIFQVTCILS